MRRLVVAALLIGCHRDLTVNPCSHNPELCEETGTDTGSDETSIDIDSSTDSELDSTSDDTGTVPDTATPEISADSSGVDSIVVTDSSIVDSVVVDSMSMDAGDTCVCVPGETVAGTGACTNVLEKKTKTCTASCTWGPETCALPRGWTAIADAPIPGRSSATAVWTGSDVIVYGGTKSSGADAGIVKNDGATYSFATNTWTALPTPSATTAARHTHGAVWTGSEMLVWGGCGDKCTTLRNDGLAYDPATKTWSMMGETTLTARYAAATVWIPTIKKMFVWGGENGDSLRDGALYDPISRTWTVLPAAPMGARYAARAVWTGTEVLVWGGAMVMGSSIIALADGGLYDPSTNTWRMAPSAPIAARFSPALVHDTDSLIVFGGYLSTGWSSEGARLSLTSLTWTTLPLAPSSFGAREYARGWLLGGSLFLWGGTTGTLTVFPSDGIELAPGGTTWSTFSGSMAPGGRIGFHTVVTPNFTWVWGGQGDAAIVEWPTIGGVFAR